MSELTVPTVDFSTLGELGNIYRKANADQARQQTLSSLGQGADVDSNALLRSGDLSLAQLGISMRNRQEDNTRQTAQDALANQHWKDTFSLQKRAADRADDPTPTGWVKDASVEGGYRGIGPNDPTYIARLAADAARIKGDQPQIMGAGSSVIIPNKAEQGALFTNRFSGTGLSENAIDIKARQLINGDHSGLTNIGRGAQAGQTLEAVSNRAAEILGEQGMNPQDAAAHLGRQVQAFKASSMGQGAEARTAGVREANLGLILRATEAAIPAALQASDAVQRTGWVPLNKIIQKGEVATSNPELKRFGMANLQLAEHWARAMNPTGVMRESDRDKALEFLGTADSNSTYKAAVNQLHTQIVRERDAVKGSPVTPAAPSFRPGDVVNDPSQGNLTVPAQKPANVTSSGIKWSVQ